MKTMRLLSVLAVSLLACCATPQSPATGRPNVLIIFTDDQGMGDIGAWGATDIKTPNMDRLAREGVRFTDFHAAASVCSPSRAALLTGRYTIRAGVPSNVPYWQRPSGMPAEQITVAELVKPLGYRTALVGKWHLGWGDTQSPNGQGFDHQFGHMGGCVDFWSHFFYWSGPNAHDLWRNGEEIFRDGEHITDLITEEAMGFIDRNRESPFLMYVAFNAPHYPIQPLQENLKHFPESLGRARRDYCAFVKHLDDSIGRIIGRLEKRGLRRKTLVFFASDHGRSVEERTNGAGGSSGPYRGHKFTLFDGGVRTPFIVSWPGTLPQGESRDHLGMLIDVFATVSDVTGAKVASGYKIDGRSLLPVLRDKDAPAPHDALFWDLWGQKAVRRGPWKLILNSRKLDDEGVQPPKVFLANLEKDIGERTNLAEKHPEVVKELTELHEAWLKDVSSGQ